MPTYSSLPDNFPIKAPYPTPLPAPIPPSDVPYALRPQNIRNELVSPTVEPAILPVSKSKSTLEKVGSSCFCYGHSPSIPPFIRLIVAGSFLSRGSYLDSALMTYTAPGTLQNRSAHSRISKISRMTHTKVFVTSFLEKSNFSLCGIYRRQQTPFAHCTRRQARR
jgi:hypothetical protein